MHAQLQLHRGGPAPTVAPEGSGHGTGGVSAVAAHPERKEELDEAHALASQTLRPPIGGGSDLSFPSQVGALTRAYPATDTSIAAAVRAAG